MCVCASVIYNKDYLLTYSTTNNLTYLLTYLFTSIILCFNKHRLTQFTWKMAIKTERETVLTVR